MGGKSILCNTFTRASSINDFSLNQGPECVILKGYQKIESKIPGCICRFALGFCKNKKERTETLYQSFSPFMVEVWGVEPQSENRTTGLSPCAFYVLTFPLPRRRRRRCGFSSFIKSRPPQSLSGLVPCFYDADGLRRRRLRVDDRGLSRESYVFVVVSSF